MNSTFFYLASFNIVFDCYFRFNNLMWIMVIFEWNDFHLISKVSDTRVSNKDNRINNETIMLCLVGRNEICLEWNEIKNGMVKEWKEGWMEWSIQNSCLVHFFYDWNGMNHSIHLSCLVTRRNGMIINYFFSKFFHMNFNFQNL